jgi:hypothetical protein
MSREAIRDEVGAIRTMTEAIAWARSRTPPATFVNAVAQDEFTHDVIVLVGHEVYVVFDTS